MPCSGGIAQEAGQASSKETGSHNESSNNQIRFLRRLSFLTCRAPRHSAGNRAERTRRIRKKIRWITSAPNSTTPRRTIKSPLAENKPGKIVDGDIDVKALLLKDTIDLSKPEQYAAVMGLIRNLVTPKLRSKSAKDALNVEESREWILRARQVKSARNLASGIFDANGLHPAGGPPRSRRAIGPAHATAARAPAAGI